MTNWRSVSIASGLALLLVGHALAYRVGETVYFTFVPRDLAGVQCAPVSGMKMLLYKNGAVFDSSKSYPSGGISALAPNTTHVYSWSYTIPATLASFTGTLFPVMRYATSDIAQDFAAPNPATVPVNFSPIDTVRAAELQDYWVAATSSTSTVIDVTDSPLTVVSYQGSPVGGAQVYAFTDSKGRYIAGYTTSDSDGKYYIRVPLNPASADTFWVSAYYANRWVKTLQRVIF